MKCPNCRCEIGNLTECPYCGARLYRRAEQPTAESRTRPATSLTRPATSRTQPAASRTQPAASRTQPAASRTQPAASRTRSATSRTRETTKFTHYTPEQRRDRHINNIDTWGLLAVILLAGIFLMQLLELILMGMQFGG